MPSMSLGMVSKLITIKQMKIIPFIVLLSNFTRAQAVKKVFS